MASFEELLHSDHAQEDYAQWILELPGLPMTLKRLSGINLNNHGQCSRELFPSLKFSKGAIDFYMAHFVLYVEFFNFLLPLCLSFNR